MNWTKLAYVLEQELERLRPRLQMALAASRLLPHLTCSRLRTELLRKAGLRIGRNSLVMGELTITGEADFRTQFVVGSGTMLTCPLYIDLGALVSIGDGVRIGHQVTILTVDHEIGGPRLRCGPHRVAPVTIGHGVWIGARAILLPGVTIGDGAVVGAGAVVTKSVAPNTLVAGVPARLVRSLDDGEANAGWTTDTAPESEAKLIS